MQFVAHVRLVGPGARALAIGLGVGTAVSGLQQHGVAVDVIELHREVRSAHEQRGDLTVSSWHRTIPTLH